MSNKRERVLLMDLIDGFRELDEPNDGRTWTEHLADHLLSHGVTLRESGEWKEVRIVRYNNGKPYTQIAHECSNCRWLNKKNKGWNTNYCPNCSAEMKKGEVK